MRQILEYTDLGTEAEKLLTENNLWELYFYSVHSGHLIWGIPLEFHKRMSNGYDPRLLNCIEEFPLDYVMKNGFSLYRGIPVIDAPYELGLGIRLNNRYYNIEEDA
jgi:hypothetical protein